MIAKVNRSHLQSRESGRNDFPASVRYRRYLLMVRARDNLDARAKKKNGRRTHVPSNLSTHTGHVDSRIRCTSFSHGRSARRDPEWRGHDGADSAGGKARFPPLRGCPVQTIRAERPRAPVTRLCGLCRPRARGRRKTCARFERLRALRRAPSRGEDRRAK